MPVYLDEPPRADGRTQDDTTLDAIGAYLDAWEELVEESIAVYLAAIREHYAPVVKLRGVPRTDGRTIEATHRALWVERLRDPATKQALGKLANSHTGGRCCLGVGCDIAVELGVIPSYSWSDADWTCYPEVKRLFGLATNSGYFVDEGGLENLTNLNDHGTPFPAIAEIIESEPEGLFR